MNVNELLPQCVAVAYVNITIVGFLLGLKDFEILSKVLINLDSVDQSVLLVNGTWGFIKFQIA